MANYDPREGRAHREDEWMLNLPPDLKHTTSKFVEGNPELAVGTSSYFYETPNMGERVKTDSEGNICDFDLHMEPPRMLSSDFTLHHQNPSLLPGDSSLHWKTPHMPSPNEHCSLDFVEPVILLNPNHITIQQSKPKISLGLSSMIIEEAVPILLSSKDAIRFRHNIPKMIDQTQSELEKNEPLLTAKTEPTLQKNEPKIARGLEATELEKNEPILHLGKSELLETVPVMTENYNKCELEQSEPLFCPGESVLLQSVPVINIGKTLLTWRLPLLRAGISMLKHRVPLLAKGKTELEHNLPKGDLKPGELFHNMPRFSSNAVSELQYEMPDVRHTEQIFIHRTPVLVE